MSKPTEYLGVIVIPNEKLLDLLAGNITLDSPEEVHVIGIYPNHITHSLEIVIQSEEEVPGVTYKREEGTEIPRSEMHAVGLGKIKLGEH